MRRYREPNYKAFFIIMLVVCLVMLSYGGIVYLANSLKNNTPAVRSASQYTPRPRLYYTDAPRNTYQYIGNRRSHVFHRPSCSSVTQMNRSNRVYLESRQEAIDKDYTPCGRCHP